VVVGAVAKVVFFPNLAERRCDLIDGNAVDIDDANCVRREAAEDLRISLVARTIGHFFEK
jgi:hypothetical protein